jgi:hypothetical protein
MPSFRIPWRLSEGGHAGPPLRNAASCLVLSPLSRRGGSKAGRRGLEIRHSGPRSGIHAFIPDSMAPQRGRTHRSSPTKCSLQQLCLVLSPSCTHADQHSLAYSPERFPTPGSWCIIGDTLETMHRGSGPPTRISRAAAPATMPREVHDEVYHCLAVGSPRRRAGDHLADLRLTL